MIKQLYRFINPKFQNLFLDYPVDQKPRFGHGRPTHTLLDEIISKNKSKYSDFLSLMLDYSESVLIMMDDHPSGLTWQNGYLPGLDILGLYTMLSQFRPAQYVEIGSGYTTIVARRAISDQQLDVQLISIDPKPRAEIDQLADQVIRQKLEDMDLSFVDGLSAGDILFVDNSHRILPNSDSNVFFLEILPRIKKGVIVHLHDIYLPHDYPQFMCDRSYSEQYGLAIALLSNPAKYDILLPNFFISENAELSEMISSIWKDERSAGAERHGGSFWFRVN